VRQVLIKNGEVEVAQVPAPQVGARNILVRVSHSCISAGTEVAGVQDSANSFFRRLVEKPGNLKKGLQFVRDEGIARGWSLATGKLAEAQPTGYSATGVIIEIGSEVAGFKPGDAVACAGAGIANHAEIIDVPVNLAVKIPENLDLRLASTVTLGAIALQGVRRCNPTLGETVVVFGLGIIGQLIVQLLLANGCRVIGVDLDSNRVKSALDCGLTHGIDPSSENVVEHIHLLTDSFGADAAIIAASTASHQVVSQAMNACRKKGRVVLVGNVGLNLNRRDFYAKELDFFISCSYGPGRYDPAYEEKGADYPLGYVRWTENRNMQAYLDLLAAGKLNLSRLPTQMCNVEQAANGFRALAAEHKPLLVFLEYCNHDQPRGPGRKTLLRTVTAKGDRISVAVVGAGGFAQGVHLPNLIKLRDAYQIVAVASRTGSNALNVARRFEAAYATTDFQQILNDEQIALVIICTRHFLHAPLVLQALRAGKHVLVEKPLCLNQDELLEIEDFFRGGGQGQVLMTGFNRRFSPAISLIRQWLQGRNSPLVINYRMNAGFLPLDHWVHSQEGGGRNIGEACHIYDLFNYLVGAKVQSIQASSIRPTGQWSAKDNFVATVTFADGSLCTLAYTALGSKAYPKERMEIFVDGKVISLDDFQSVTIAGAKHRGWHSQAPEKGQLEELRTLAQCLQSGGPWPIPLGQQVAAMELCFKVEQQL
jgi:predicted dehydrogenase